MALNVYMVLHYLKSLVMRKSRPFLVKNRRDPHCRCVIRSCFKCIVIIVLKISRMKERIGKFKRVIVQGKLGNSIIQLPKIQYMQEKENATLPNYLDWNNWTIHKKNKLNCGCINDTVVVCCQRKFINKSERNLCRKRSYFQK